MPVTTSYPGIYIDELPLSAHAISAAPTSIAAFVGYSHPYKTRTFRKAVRLFSFTDYEREFGGLFASGIVDTQLGHAVNQFFLNGGSEAWVVGLEAQNFGNAGAATITTTGSQGFVLTAKGLTDVLPLKVSITNIRAGATSALTAFDLILIQGSAVETFRGLDITATGDQAIGAILTARSTLASAAPASGGIGAAFASNAKIAAEIAQTPPSGFTSTFAASDYLNQLKADAPLDKVEIFNLLVLPGVIDNGVVSAALSFAERKRAFMIVDPPYGSAADDSGTLPAIDSLMDSAVPRSQNGAIYFPWLMSSDPVRGETIPMPPSGFVAGLYARTDSQRGVWKAPAGMASNVLNTSGPVAHGLMNDQRHGVLNLAGINALRAFTGAGTVVFGARTLVGNEGSAFPQSKYVPVRRMTLFIEQTLLANLRWVVFEPNDEPLWAAIRSSIGNFMLSLFNQQALAGTKPSEAFQVKCDATTTTSDDQANGIVNIVVAFAPLKPAEFVVIKIAQLAGQSAA